jgi:hypothetical protein
MVKARQKMFGIRKRKLVKQTGQGYNERKSVSGILAERIMK